MTKIWGRWLGALLVCGTLLGTLRAEDVLLRHRVAGKAGVVADYTGAVLEEAMRRTMRKYGPYRLEDVAMTLARERLLVELRDGTQLNLAVVATQPSWEEQLLPIRIPVDMGLSGYRFSLIHRQNQALIASIHSSAAVRHLSIAIGAGWSSRSAFESAGFSLRQGESYEALLRLVLSGRADLFPRSFNELVAEFDQHAAQHPDLAIEESMAIYFPLPTYIFVSPRTPRLAARLEEGLESMLRDGTLHALLRQHHGPLLQRVKFCSRRIFRIDNPLLDARTPLARKALWFDPFDPRNGLCPRKG